MLNTYKTENFSGVDALCTLFIVEKVYSVSKKISPDHNNMQACRSQGCRGCHILADQLTLSQPDGADYAHQITTDTPGFLDFPRALRRESTSI